MLQSINWTDVESSNIAAMAHEEETGKMLVKFKAGTVYEYHNVPRSIYDDVVSAASVGCTFNQLIKSQPAVYPFEQRV